jgi:hypothetical protein
LKDGGKFAVEGQDGDASTIRSVPIAKTVKALLILTFMVNE